ncbi:cell filamentation protein Fic [Candidatus Woesearchaeota archaeon B3_Woes]|nr:MAG: cell filamentation protein Fic [Candidatus Woesearchaeota archaeon B3_Woes]
MFIEIRKQGKKKKYYLIHSYRLGDKVNRISRYLGSDLDKKTLEKLKKISEKIIFEQIKEKSLFEFELSKEEIGYYKKYENKLEINHFQVNWKRFTQEFVFNTNAIEGSMVDYSEVKDLLGKKDEPKNNDEIETINVAKAVEYIKTTKDDFSIGFIRKLHELCFDKTKSFAGELRDVEVIIRDKIGKVIHQGAPVKDVEKLLKNLVRWFNEHKKKYPPLLLAALVHNQFENIHPFQDGNGRVGRLLLNYILLQFDYPPLNIRLKDREKYYRVLQEFDKDNDIKPTLRFFILEYRKQYK